MLEGERRQTAWITKYAVTSGIVYVPNCTISIHDGREYTANRDMGAGQNIFCRVGTDAFFTEEEANANAAKKVKAKLVSLQKQKKQLEEKLAVFQGKKT